MSDDERPKILWDRAMLARFKRTYNALPQELDWNGTFTFDGHEFVVSYAKYLIEFLDNQFGNTKT